jgi:hypothetical protein
MTHYTGQGKKYYKKLLRMKIGRKGISFSDAFRYTEQWSNNSHLLFSKGITR